MDKLQNLIKALNIASDNISGDTAIMFSEKDEEGKVIGKYFIKERPVANAEGIEVLQYVARAQK